MYHTSVEHWKQLLEEFLTITHDLCEDLLLQARKRAFRDWAQTKLYQELRKATDQFFELQFAELRKFVTLLHQTETRRLWTLNKEAKEDAETSASADLEMKRLRNRVSQRLGSQPARDSERKRMEDIVLQETDPYRQEIAEMAVSPPYSSSYLWLTVSLQFTRAYYSCASNRFADTVANIIRNMLFTNIQEGLPNSLIRHLGLDKQDANDRCRMLLTTDPSIEVERSRLQAEQRNIEEAKSRIQMLLNEGKLKREEAMTALAGMEIGSDTTMGGTEGHEE